MTNISGMFKNNFDTQMKELSAAGKRVKRKQADTISCEQEENLWRSGLTNRINC
jgi:hypothetical protein